MTRPFIRCRSFKESNKKKLKIKSRYPHTSIYMYIYISFLIFVKEGKSTFLNSKGLRGKKVKIYTYTYIGTYLAPEALKISAQWSGL